MKQKAEQIEKILERFKLEIARLRVVELTTEIYEQRAGELRRETVEVAEAEEKIVFIRRKAVGLIEKAKADAILAAVEE